MSERTKRAISELTGLLSQPDNQDLSLRIIQAEFTAAACTQRAVKVRATDDAIQSLSARLVDFPRGQWGAIREASEALIRDMTYEKDIPASLAAMHEIWGRVMRQARFAG